jgi:hypothetical protein
MQSAVKRRKINLKRLSVKINMDYLHTVAQYMSADECHILAQTTGADPFCDEEWCRRYFAQHKQRMAGTLNVIAGMLYTSDHSASAAAIRDCSISEISNRYLPNGARVLTIYEKRPSRHAKLEVHNSTRKNNERIIPRSLMRLLTRGYRFAYPYGDCQMVELVGIKKHCVAIFSVLLPCGILEYAPGSTRKIRADWQLWMREQ